MRGPPFFDGLHGLSFVVSVWPFFLSTARHGIHDVVDRCSHQIRLPDKQALEVSGQGNQCILHVYFEFQLAISGFLLARQVFLFRKALFDFRGQNAIQCNQYKMSK